MDALRIIMIIGIASVTALHTAGAVMPETEFPDITDPNPEIDVPESTTPLPATSSTAREPPRNCVTAKGVAGVCASRQECDHSTGPVDHTLFKPSWYNSSCLDDEVCCPFNALIPETPSEKGFDDENF